MSSQFVGSVLLLQEAVGVSFHNHLKRESRLTRGMSPSNAAYSHQPGGFKLLLWICSGIPARHGSTVKHDMPAAVHTFQRWPCFLKNCSSGGGGVRYCGPDGSMRGTELEARP
jgi:hypothetical protein